MNWCITCGSVSHTHHTKVILAIKFIIRCVSFACCPVNCIALKMNRRGEKEIRQLFFFLNDHKFIIILMIFHNEIDTKAARQKRKKNIRATPKDTTTA